MPKCHVLGMSTRITGTSKKTGYAFDFTNLHLSYSDPQILGSAVMVQGVNSDLIPPALRPDMDVYIEFNQRGRVEAIRIFPDDSN